MVNGKRRRNESRTRIIADTARGSLSSQFLSSSSCALDAKNGCSSPLGVSPPRVARLGASSRVRFSLPSFLFWMLLEEPSRRSSRLPTSSTGSVAGDVFRTSRHMDGNQPKQTRLKSRLLTTRCISFQHEISTRR
jgi:hypothetical protein